MGEEFGTKRLTNLLPAYLEDLKHRAENPHLYEHEIHNWLANHNKKPHKYEEYKVLFDVETLEQMEKLQRMYFNDVSRPGEIFAAAIHCLTERIVEERKSNRYRMSDHDKWCHQVYISYPDRDEDEVY